MAANKKFDIQLAHGLMHEARLKEILEGAKIELKTETHQWEQTGNICIEYEHNGKKSGIAATEADFWVHELVSASGSIYLMFPRERLLALTRAYYAKGWHRENAGDGGKSKVVLLPLDKILTE